MWVLSNVSDFHFYLQKLAREYDTKPLGQNYSYDLKIGAEKWECKKLDLDGSFRLGVESQTKYSDLVSFIVNLFDKVKKAIPLLLESQLKDELINVESKAYNIPKGPSRTSLYDGLKKSEVSESNLKKANEVIEKLTGKGIPTNNTLCFVYSQIITCADAIRRGYDFAIEQGVDMERWRSVITHMEGRFGEDLESQAKAQGVHLNEGEIRLAELAIFKKAYRYIKCQGILTKLLSCSLRVGPTVNGKQRIWHLEHKRGSNIVVTCPPSFLERLTLLDLEYVDNFTIDDQISPTVMEKLLKISSFVESYEENGFAPEEYSQLPVFEKTKSEHLLATMEFLEFVS